MHFLKDVLTSKQLKKRYSLYFSWLGLSHGMKMRYTQASVYTDKEKKRNKLNGLGQVKDGYKLGNNLSPDQTWGW